MKTAFVFPGQGSQTIGMGKDFYDNTEIGKEYFTKADEILPYSLSKLCFEGPIEELSKTIHSQPALYVVSVIASVIAKEQGIIPCAYAGHSAGEYGALCAAGAYTFEEGLKFIFKRAVAMNECAEKNPGKMAAVLNLDIEKIKEILSNIDGICIPANINSLVQTVISGDAKSVDIAMEKCKEAGAKRVVPLAVSGAFHSPLMADAKNKFAKDVEEMVINPIKNPVVSIYTADVETEPNEIKFNLLNAITGSVRWVEVCQKFVSMGIEQVYECGVGSVLCGLIKKTTPEIAGKKISCLADFEN